LTVTNRGHATAPFRLVLHNRPHTLLTGPAAAVDLTLAALMPLLEPPVCGWTPGEPLPPPAHIGTLVCRDVDRSTPDEQMALAIWLSQAALDRPQVISTTTVALWRLVTEGLFLDTLYYCLNSVLIDVGESKRS
jgi:hypothetical protein